MIVARFARLLGFFLAGSLAAQLAFGTSAHAAQTFNDPLDFFSYFFDSKSTQPAPKRKSPAQQPSSNNSVPIPPVRPAQIPSSNSSVPIPPIRPAELGPKTEPPKKTPLPPTSPSAPSAPSASPNGPAPGSKVAPPRSAPGPTPNQPQDRGQKQQSKPPIGKKEEAPVAEKSPKAPNSNCDLKKFRDEIGQELDKAIASLGERVQKLENSANQLGTGLDTLLKKSSCTSVLSRGSFARELGPQSAHQNLTLGQYKKLLPQKVWNGFTANGKQLMGLKELMAQLKKAKTSIAGFDFCSVDACTGAVSAFKSEISPIVVKVNMAKDTMDKLGEELARDLREEAQRAGKSTIDDLKSDFLTSSECAAEVIPLGHQVDALSDSYQASFSSLKQDIDKRANILNAKLVQRLDGITCGAVQK